MSRDWNDVQTPPDGRHPLRDGYRRYHRLNRTELDMLRGQLERLEQEAQEAAGGERPETADNLAALSAVFRIRSYASTADHLRELSGYDWNWDYIFYNAAKMRGRARLVEGALNDLPEGSCRDVFRRAVRRGTYDPQAHQEAIRQFQVEQMDRSKMRARQATIKQAWDDPEDVEPAKIGARYRDAGWSGARKGGREELEALTDAILWATRRQD